MGKPSSYYFNLNDKDRDRGLRIVGNFGEVANRWGETIGDLTNRFAGVW